MAVNTEHCDDLSDEDDTIDWCARSQENVELLEKDCGIVNDFNDSKESAVTDSNSDNDIGSMLEQDSRRIMFLSRRHSVGDNITALSPIKPVPNFRRRCSLQIPSRLHNSVTSEYNNSSRGQLLNGNRNQYIPMIGIGSELFVAFLHEEINRSHLKVPESIENTPCGLSSSNGDGGVVHEFLSLGAHLRLMADEFASSDHRQHVRERAERVSLNDLDAESFTDLLFGMFQEGGVTCERVLVLFVFCADLAVRALREHLLTCFNNVMNWSQLYIESWLTPWIQRHGGWTVVLERSVHEAYKAAVIGTCVVGILALWTYIRTAGH